MRIVLALDGSPSSLQARDLVAGLAWPNGLTVQLVSAYDVPIDWTGGVGSTMDWVGDAEDALRDELLEELRRLARPLEDRGWQVERRVIKGRAATAIMNAARELGADLIVLGSRGRGPLRSMLLGSVSAEVADHAPCPVLVARGDRISRLLVASDGSDVARSTPDLLEALGAFRGVQAQTLSVAPVDPPTFELLSNAYTLGSYPLARDLEELLEDYRRHADVAAQRLETIGIPATPVVRSGDAAHEIIETARSGGTDLIVIGSRGLGGLERVVLGSVARNVLLHASCSVLIHRAGVSARSEEARALDAAAPAGS
jgi:Universal stress protein UspA and related nucleotide-binding proteins